MIASGTFILLTRKRITYGWHSGGAERVHPSAISSGTVIIIVQTIISAASLTTLRTLYMKFSTAVFLGTMSLLVRFRVIYAANHTLFAKIISIVVVESTVDNEEKRRPRRLAGGVNFVAVPSKIDALLGGRVVR